MTSFGNERLIRVEYSGSYNILLYKPRMFGNVEPIDHENILCLGVLLPFDNFFCPFIVSMLPI